MCKLNILVVDDDRDFAESLAELVESQGHAVDLAFDGDEALWRVREKNYGLVLMDVRMPGLNGVETFLEIKRAQQDSKVVLMTAYSMEELLQEAVNNGVAAVLDKPFQPAELISILSRMGGEGYVLIADDDEDFASGLASVLTEEGFTVRTAPSGEEALRIVEGCKVKLALLDIRLPGMNGLDLYRKLRTVSPGTTAILMTGFELDEWSGHPTLSMGEVLSKPFDPQKLLHLIKNLSH